MIDLVVELTTAVQDLHGWRMKGERLVERWLAAGELSVSGEAAGKSESAGPLEFSAGGGLETLEAEAWRF